MSVLLLISPESWDGHAVSKHHYAVELARRKHRVLFYGPPEHGGSLRVERVKSQHVEIEVVRGPKVAPGLRYMPTMIRRRLEATWLRKLECIIGQNIDVVWLFENSRFFDMRFAGERLKIYHQVDLNQNFHPGIAARTADKVFCVTRRIQDKLASFEVNAVRIQHGLAFLEPSGDINPEGFVEAGINVVYVGNLSMKLIDKDSIINCIKKHTKVVFHFLGSRDDADLFQNHLRSYGNVRLHGKVASEHIQDFLAAADVLLLCYDSRYWLQASNSHKLMEYLASGKVVVASFTEEYKESSDLLAMAGLGDDFCALFDKVLANLSYWNCADRQEARKAFAENHTYDKQLDKIVANLGPRGSILLGSVQRNENEVVS